MGLLLTYVILPSIIWIGETGKKVNKFASNHFPKIWKFVGTVAFWIYALVFIGLFSFIMFKDCSDTIHNHDYDSEYFDDAHRPDKF